MREKSVPDGWIIRMTVPNMVMATVLSVFVFVPASADSLSTNPSQKKSMGNFQIQVLMSTCNQSEGEKKGRSTKKAK